ncbi:MAG TPA: helix-hairpin-helix domain-containing protein [Pedobacter sp.]|nr:helix-hairpin-helix domain-containing protein [Pedobacter sp.]
MKKWLNIYFDLSKREFNGLLVLAALIITVTAFPYLYEVLVNDPGRKASDLPVIKKLIREMQAEELKMKYPAQGSSFTRHEAARPAGELFAFDPNQISAAGWQRLGLSEKQAAVILNYRAKGGRFRIPADLQKMYTISPKLYLKLSPYVRIAPAQNVQRTENGPVSEKHPAQAGNLKVIELNGSDSAALCEISGIGPVFASRIMRYRQRLGGFHKTAQLMEVYGLDSTKYAEIKDQVRVDDSRIKRIHINTAGFDELKNLPYLRYKQINALIQYRKQHGNYSNIADLNKVQILSPEIIARIEPYLIF